MPKRKYVSKEDYEILREKLEKIEKEVQKKAKRPRRRTRVLYSSSSSEDDSHTRRSPSEDRPEGNQSNHSEPPLNDSNASPGHDDAEGAPAPELDTDILEILGVDPTKSEKFGKEIQKDVAVRFEHTTTSGLSKEDRKEITTKYLIPENCKLIGAPALNPEIKVALSEAVVKRDAVIESKQKLMASAISSLGEAITLVLSSKEKNTDLLRLLIDTGKTICDCQHHETNVRRNFVTFAVKKDMKESLQNTKIDTFLFGQNLAETLKTAKAINKQGAELKPPSAPKASTSKATVAGASKNWKGQVRTNPVRTHPAASKTTTASKTSATKSQRGSSYKPSQSHRASHTRR